MDARRLEGHGRERRVHSCAGSDGTGRHDHRDGGRTQGTGAGTRRQPCRNAAPLVAARLVAAAALGRQESRGGHFRVDYPGSNPPERTFTTLAQAERPGLRYAAE